ncbi:hypothetical protein [Corallococcus sp. AS-1-12]|uniref:hypothetical protein n=1 Tax=Corallococcus sp. AS-1-12 TaxID=2874598 RepID=UPI001CBFA170|nr:hypothetical protein [Corallococcus sp. AS-1-12]MBZ4333467.1 hypothetical protein [Corallococcus sp. AS-1-12]
MLTLGAGAVIVQPQGTMTVQTFDAGLPIVVAEPFDAGVEDAGVNGGPVMGILDLTAWR